MADVYTSASTELFKWVVSTLTRQGVNVGGTAAYPRAEVSTLTENGPSDKDNSVRSSALVLESISDRSLGEAYDINATNLALLQDADDTLDNYRIVGVVEGTISTMEDMGEASLVLYRVINNLTIYVSEI